MVLVSVNVRKGKERGKGEKENIVRLVQRVRTGVARVSAVIVCVVASLVAPKGFRNFQNLER